VEAHPILCFSQQNRFNDSGQLLWDVPMQSRCTALTEGILNISDHTLLHCPKLQHINIHVEVRRLPLAALVQRIC